MAASTSTGNSLWVDPSTWVVTGPAIASASAAPNPSALLQASLDDVPSVVSVEEEDPSPGDTGYFWQTDFDKHIIVEPGKLTLPDGRVITRDRRYNAPITHELVEALKWAESERCRSLILKGVLNGAHLGGGDKNKAFVVAWSGRPISGVVARSADPANPALIKGLSFTGDVRSSTSAFLAGNTGVGRILFKDVTIRNPATGSSCVGVAAHSWQGLLGFHNCRFTGESTTTFGGTGINWNIRAHGRGRYDIRNGSFAAAREHHIYLDSVGADGLGDTYITDCISLGPTGRTAVQLVNRGDPNALWAGGPTGLGAVFIQRNKFAATGGSGGGGVITVAGHLGPVYIEDNELSAGKDEGGIVVWTDGGKKPHRTPGGFSHTFVRLINNNITGTTGCRNAMMLSGIEHLIIDEFVAKGCPTAIDLFNKFGGSIDNGLVEITAGRPGRLSQYSGFQSGRKMMYRGLTLSDTAIDAYQKAE